MATRTKKLASTRWFFILVAIVVLYLSWKIVEPLALTLITAAVFAIVLTPIDRRLRRALKRPKISALLMVLLTFVIIVLPLFLVGVLIIDQSKEILSLAQGETFLSSFDVRQTPLFLSLPSVIQEWLTSLDVAQIGRSIANWAATSLQAGLSDVVRVIFNTFFFFVALYYILLERDTIYQQVLLLSPLKDKLDSQIVHRIVSTTRGVVFGALIVALIQAILATLGLTIFGVPGAFLWGALALIASQIPFLGIGLIMVPSVIYLFATGNVESAIGLLIWAIVVVGMVENVLSPYLIQGRTKMHALLILISILGGLQLFGPIGFIIGPTILAALMVILDLYKTGILESKS